MTSPGGIEGARVFVRVLPNTSDFAKALSRYLERVEKRTLLKIRTEADTGRLARDVHAAVTQAQKSALIEVAAKVDARGIVRETRRAASVAEKSARLRLPVDLDVKSLAAGIGRVAGLLGGLLKAGTLALALAGAAAQAAALAKALAPAAGIVAALPGIAVTAAAAFGALKLGMSGVGDALSGDADALARLAPSARDFVEQARALAPAWQSVKNAVQGNLFAGLAGSLRDVAGVWLPILRTQLAGLGAAWSQGFAGLAQVATSTPFVQSMSEALSTSTTATRSLAGALGPLLSILGTLAPFGAQFAAGMAGGLQQAATNVAAFLLQAKESGQLAAFFTTVRTTLSQLGGILVQLGGIFHAVFSAAAESGGGLLGNLKLILTQVNAFLSAGAGQSALQTFFASASTVLKSLLPVVMTLAGGIGSVLAPAIGKIASLLGPALQTVAQSLVGIVSGLVDSGALDALASALGDGLAALGPALVPVAKALGSIVKAAAPLLAVVGKLAGVLAGVLGSALEALAPLLDALVEAIASSGLTDVLAEIGAQLGPLLGQLVSALMPTIKALLPLLGPIVKVVGALLQVVLALLGPLIALVAPFIELYAIKVLTPVVTLLSEALLWLVDKALIPAAEWLSNLGDTVSGLDWGAIWQTVVDGVKTAIQWFTDLPGKILAALLALLGNLRTWAVSALAALGSAVLAGLNNAVAFFASLPSRVVNAVFTLPGRLLSWAGGMMASLVSFLASALVNWLSFWSGLPARVVSAVSALRGRLLSFLSGVWSAARSAFASGVSAAVALAASLPGRAVSALSSLAGRVKGVFASAGSWLVDAGRRILQGLIDGIQSMINKLKDKLRQVTNLIPDWKGPAEVDRRLLKPSGQLIMRGLIDGIAASLPALRKQLDAVTGDIRTGVDVMPRQPFIPSGTRRRIPPLDPAWMREQVLSLTALVKVGDEPIYRAVDAALSKEPARVAGTVAVGTQMIDRRG